MIIITVASYNGTPTPQRLAAQFDELGGNIGRAENNQLVLPDPERTISRVHAQVVFRAGRYAIVDRGSMRLGSLAETLGTTDATASRTVDVLEGHGLAERRPDPADARGVIVAASPEGKADVRRRRRRLERLAARALGDLSHDEARRVASALAELQTLLERR